ncbi:hypothetical protein Hanom_Chr04g00361761 [Helianthus anomalus]
MMITTTSRYSPPGPPEYVEISGCDRFLKQKMAPRVRGRGKGPMRGGPSSQAGPSHRRTPSASDSSDHWSHPFEPARRSISLSSSPTDYFSWA